MKEDKIYELQVLEQNLQNLILQKQAFQMELSETESALEEINKSGEEVFKIIGQLMIKKNKEEIKKDLEEKQKILNMRLKPFEKQESTILGKIEEIRQEILGENSPSKKN